MRTNPLFLGQTQRIALGQQHNCYIGNCGSSHQQRLYVWGNNQDNYLSPFGKEQQQSSDDADPHVLAWPTYIPLKFNQQEYEPVTVNCGANYVMVIGHLISQKEKNQNSNEADSFKKISQALKEILVQKGSLIDFFKPEQKYQQRKDFQQNFYKEAAKKKADQTSDEVDSNTVMISRNQFITQITQKYEDHPLADQSEAGYLSHYLFKKAGTVEISVHEIEDFALGFMQNEIKLFFFGRAEQSLLSFKRKKIMMGQDTLSDIMNDSQSEGVTIPLGRRSESSEEQDPNMIFVVQSPTAILFPKFTDPIMSVSCGLSHCLAVTKTGKLYSWGNGAYGALGFGNVHSITQPQELEIKQNSFVLQIQQVSCGSLHSMAVTTQNKLFTWGTGKHGRLGHGNLSDVLEPKELLQLSNQRVINISAGESHSAAVTQNLRAYTWGNGIFGRLGHGQDFIEKQPRIVEDLLVKKVAQVSCGAFHTLAITTDGELYSFGQDKYGKLGLISTQEQHRKTPIKIPIFQMKDGEDVHEPALNTKLLYVIAGFNHNLAITNKGKVLSWGFNGYSILGRNLGKRPEKQTLTCLPLPLFTDLREKIRQKKPTFKKRSHAVRTDDYEQAMAVLFQQSQESEQISTKITQVACTSNNTLILTNGGQIFVSGTNNFSQQGFSNKLKDPTDRGWFEILYFKQVYTVTVKSMACGANHVFVVSTEDQVFGWGRNIQGQLGMGFMSESVTEPTPINTLADMRISKAVCGENYSVVLTGLGKVMVAGDLECGKLGLGKAWASGIIMSFREITTLNEVKQIACGPNHMLAITKGIHGDNILYAWGGNWKCQLGVGNKDNQYEPTLVKMKPPVQFSKICCGRDFSIAIQKDTNQLFMWGNYMMSCSNDTDDFAQPTKMSWFYDRNLQIKDITVLNEYCLVCTTDNVFWWWGNFMEVKKISLDSVQDSESSQDSQSSSGQEGSQSYSGGSSSEKSENELEEQRDNLAKKEKVPEPQKLFKSSKLPPIFSQTALGFNHGAAVQVGTGYLYCWGANDCLQMGMNEDKGSNFQSYQEHNEQEPVPIKHINQILIINKKTLDEQGNNQKQPNQEQDEETPEPPKDKTNAYARSQSKMLKEDQNFYHRSRTNQTEKVTATQEEAEEDFSQEEEKDNPQDYERKTHAIVPAGTNKSPVGINEIKIEIKASLGVPFKERQKPKLANASTFTLNNIDGHIKMQLLLMEELGQFDEQSMYLQDSASQESLETILKIDMKVLQDSSQRRKNLQLQIKNTLLQRLSEAPLETLPSRDPLIIGLKSNLVPLKKMNKQIKEALSTLHLHPCYLLNLYQRDHIDADLFYKVIKMIYPNKHPAERDNENDANFNLMPYQLSQEAERVNYLIISIVQKILEKELKGKNIDEIDLVGPGCHLIGRLFKYVFKSQPTNIDTICTIVCQLVNQLAHIMLNDKEEAGVPGNEEDVKLSEFQRFLGKEALAEEDLMERYFEILKELVTQIKTNKVLSSPVQQLYSQRKPVSDILKSNQQFQYSSLRFSSEVSLLLEMIRSELKNTFSVCTNDKAELDKKIQEKLFWMCFQMVQTVWEDLNLYASPYFKNKKVSQAIMLKFVKHKNGLNQFFEVVKCFFNGKNVYEDNETAKDMESVKNLQNKIADLRDEVTPEILKNIIDRSSNLGPNMISLKNFENLVLHSCRCEDFTISVDTDLLSTLLTKLYKNKKTVALLDPPQNDSLFKSFTNFKQFSDLIKKSGRTRINFVLKLRLLSEMHMELNRCTFCSAILTSTYNTLEKSPIFEQYDPEDKECLFSRYTQVISNKGKPLTQNLLLKSDNKSLSEQLVAIQERLNRTANFEMAQSIQLLFNGVDETFREPDVDMTEEAIEQQRNKVFKELLQQAQDKMNQRRKHSHNLKQLKERIKTFLKKAVSKRLQAIKEYESRQQILVFNLLYGLANNELLPLCQTEQTALLKMRDLKKNIYQQQFSKNLFKVLGDKQKFNLRTIIREPVVRLINNGTITDFKLQSLRSIMDNLIVVVHETQQRNIELKIFFEEIPGCCQMSNSKEQQQLLKIEITPKELFELRKEVRLIRYLTYLQLNANRVFASAVKDQSASELKQILGVKDVVKPLDEGIVSVTYQNAITFKKIKLLELINRMLHQKYAYVFQSNFSNQSIIKYQQHDQEQ